MRIPLNPSSAATFRLNRFVSALRRAVDVSLFPARAVAHKIRRPLQPVLVEKTLLAQIRNKDRMPSELRDLAAQLRNLGHRDLALVLEDEANCKAVALKVEWHQRKEALRRDGKKLLKHGVEL